MRLCPVDLHPNSFREGDARRTRLAQVATVFWRDETGVDVACYRSVSEYVEALLKNAVKGDVALG